MNSSKSEMDFMADENAKLGEMVGNLEARLAQTEGQVNFPKYDVFPKLISDFQIFLYFSRIFKDQRELTR